MRRPKPHAGLAVLDALLPLAHAMAIALALGAASLAHANTRAECEQRYTPQRGQDGKDVVWAPTADTMVARMLEMAAVTPADTVYDLGAGDGKIPIAAARDFGATAVGVEYDADLAEHAQCLVRAEGLEHRVAIVQGDIFATDFSDATVVTLYLLPAVNERLRPLLLDMRPGTRVVSYSFGMGEWDPDETAETDDGVAYFWVVPAKVDGTWSFEVQATGERFDVVLEQAFQNVVGTTRGAAVTGELKGAEVDLLVTAVDDPLRLTGVVDGDRITGTLTRGGRSSPYVATRR